MLNRSKFIDLTHLHGCIDGMMQRKNLEDMLPSMADDMVLRTPLVAEPFAGKAAIKHLVTALLGVVDKFNFREIRQGSEHVSVSFGVMIGRSSWTGWIISDSVKTAWCKR